VANLLAARGVKVALFEKHPEHYRLPRAGHIDHEALRIVQEVGALEPVLADAVPWSSNRWLTATGEVLFEFKHWVHSASSFHSSGFFQPILEDALYANIEKRAALIEIFAGWSVEDFSQDAYGVRVEARSVKDGSTMSAVAGYLLACDGADSPIRQQLGIERIDFGYNETWCCADVSYRRPCDFGPPTIFADPARPRYFGPLGRYHHRFEWKILPEELQLDHSDLQSAWRVLEDYGVSRKDVDIIRLVTYDFEYRLAERWRDRLIFLLGDAAHTTPPAMGQGMCAGMRDSANLAWKLALVIQNQADEAILNTFYSERYPHVKAWSDISLLASQVAFNSDAEVAASRDAAIRRGERPDFGPPPTMGNGLFHRARSNGSKSAGELFPQRMIWHGGEVGRFDDLAGSGFMLVAQSDLRPLFSPVATEVCRRLAVRMVSVGPGQEYLDLNGEYAQYFTQQDVQAVLVRPDRYIFSAVSDINDVSRMIEQLGKVVPAPLPREHVE
jgi:2-polyprenyl-6-methoxyphenol hydroxylase-like FAD-dependent oxidoreductase